MEPNEDKRPIRTPFSACEEFWRCMMKPAHTL